MGGWKNKVLKKEMKKNELHAASSGINTGTKIMGWFGFSSDGAKEKTKDIVKMIANNIIVYDLDEAAVRDNYVLNKLIDVKISKTLEENLARLSNLTGKKITANDLLDRIKLQLVSDHKQWKTKNKDFRDELFPKFFSNVFNSVLKEIYKEKSMTKFEEDNAVTAYNKICGAAVLLGSSIEQLAIDISNNPYCNSFLSRPTGFLPSENENKYKRSFFGSTKDVKNAINKQCSNIKLKPGEKKLDYESLYSQYIKNHATDFPKEKKRIIG